MKASLTAIQPTRHNEGAATRYRRFRKCLGRAVQTEVAYRALVRGLEGWNA